MYLKKFSIVPRMLFNFVGGGRGTEASGDAHDADKTAFTILARNSPGVLQVRAASRPPVGPF